MYRPVGAAISFSWSPFLQSWVLVLTACGTVAPPSVETSTKPKSQPSSMKYQVQKSMVSPEV